MRGRRQLQAKRTRATHVCPPRQTALQWVFYLFGASAVAWLPFWLPLQLPVARPPPGSGDGVGGSSRSPRGLELQEVMPSGGSKQALETLEESQVRARGGGGSAERLPERRAEGASARGPSERGRGLKTGSGTRTAGWNARRARWGG